MKENFTGLLEEKELKTELEKADTVKKEAERKLILYSGVMAVLWIAIIVAVFLAGYRR